ncbi:MAG: glycoside hydrolase family 18 protein [Polyangiaceae bacterium]
MRIVHYCLLGAVFSFGCSAYDNSGPPRPHSSGKNVSGSNGSAGNGSAGTTGGNVNTGGSGGAGSTTTSGSGGNAGNSGTTGTGGKAGAGGATGGAGGAGSSGGAGGATGGAGGATGGSGGATGGSGGATGGTGGATGGAGGATGGTGGATGGSGGATGGSGGATGGTGGATGGTGGKGGTGGATGGTGGTGGATGGAGGTTSIDAGTGGSGLGDGGVSIDAARPEGGAPPAAGLWIAPNHPWYEWSALPANQVPWTHLTHLGLGYVQPQASGGKYIIGAPAGWGSDWAGFRDAAKGFASAAHTAQRKAFMMVGGANTNTGDYAGVWNSATAPANIDAFADSIVTLSKEMQLDGVELDWEEDIDYPQLVALAKSVRAKWADGLIFIDTMPLDNTFTDLAPAKDVVDAFMPMTFLAISQWGGWVLPVPLTPLYGYQGNGYSVDDNLKGWTDAGVPASKVIMGVGGFGSVWADSNNDQQAPVAPYVTTNGTGAANSETASMYDDRVVTQSWVKSLIASNSGRMIEGWDDLGKCSFWHAPAATDLVAATANSKSIKAGLVFYETPRSMTEKQKYAQSKGMRGMNFWTLSQTMDGASSPILETVLP